MIYYVSLQDHNFPVRRLVASLRRDVPSLKATNYERLFHSRRAPIGHYIFTDHDRLTHYEKEVAIAICDALRKAAPGARILNDPRRVLERYPLLRRLEDCGINRFSVTRLDDGAVPPRYPVFIRCEDDHLGADTDLIRSEAEFHRAIADLSNEGKVLKRRIAVEFCAEKNEAGYYRKYGVFNVDGAITPQHILESEAWHLKSHSRKRSEAVDMEELAFIKENPHGEELSRIFKMAHIDYGRADYSIVDGRIQIYEINTNPRIGSFLPRPESKVRRERRQYRRGRMIEALRAIDVPLEPGPPARFSLPEPQFHIMRPWHPIRTTVRGCFVEPHKALRKGYPDLHKHLYSLPFLRAARRYLLRGR